MSPPKYTALPTAPTVSSQPKAASMQLDEKSPAHSQCTSPKCTHSHTQSQLDESEDASHSHRFKNHNAVLRRILLPFLVALVVLCGVLAVGSCMSGSSGGEGVMGGLGDLVGRALGDGTNTGNGQQGAFVHRKLYLIVIFVGLFVVLILAIMLSAWCCRGAFENPCCCPCYLCACCGGLACLECIGCGLCAEGIDQL